MTSRLATLAPVACMALCAQSTQISGVVFDSSGAVVPHAAATLVNQDNGTRRTARTSSEGVYAIPAVQPGPYKLTVRKDGFRSVARTGLRLEAGQAARVDFTLEVGPVEETIVVESSPLSLETESAARALVLPPSYASRLPMNGRSLLAVLELAPGVTLAPVRDASESGQFSVNGQRANTNLISVDGLSANFGIQEEAPGHTLAGNLPALSAIGSLHSLLPMSSLREFRLLTSSGPAETGRFSGGLLHLTSKSGGTEWHGEARALLRNEKLDANGWFGNAAGLPRAPLRWNQFGASAGGPAPGLDGTFLFATYEGFRLRQAEDLAILVPPESARLSPPTLLGGAVPFYPAPNFGFTPPDFGAHLTRIASRARHDAWSLRADRAVGSRTQLFLRAQSSPSSALRANSRAPSVSPYSVRESSYRPMQLSGAAGLALSPVTYLDWRVNHSRMSIRQSTRPAPLPGVRAWDPAAVGLPAQIESETVEWRRVSFGPWSALESEERGRLAQLQWQTTATLSAVRGQHQPRAGFDYRQMRPEVAAAPLSATAVFFDFEGAPPMVRLERRARVALRFHNVSLWASDTWKLHPRITVDFGLRWEWNPPPRTRGDAMPVLVVAGLNAAGEPRIGSASGDWWQARRRDFAPRAAVAWRNTPGGGMVLRAASGLHYNAAAGAVLFSLTEQPGYFSSAVAFGPPGSLRLSMLDGALPLLPGLSGAEPGLRTPVSVQSTAAVDLAWRRAGNLSFGWVNALGRRLVRSEFAPLTTGPYRFVQLTTPHGSSNYHGLQTQFRSHAMRGLETIVSYTWAHSIDNGSRDSETRLAWARRLDRGSSDFDLRHSATAAFLYTLPRGGGWHVDGIVRIRSGFPFSPIVSGWLPNPGEEYAPSFEPAVYRPNLVPGQPVWLGSPSFPGGRALNIEAFRPTPSRAMGSLGRNAIAGFGFRQLDLAVHRRFSLQRPAGLTVRAEAFNLTNTANFANPAVAISPVANPAVVAAALLANQELSRFGNGGSPTSGLLPVLHSGGARSIQISVGIDF